ncbi:MAG: hypothetical protein ACO2O5_02640 [Candidatus Caldipriscus sp.]
MKRLYLVALLGIGVLALAGCRGGGGLGGNPEVVEKVATNQGADLKLTWKSVEGAEGYKVYCDGNEIWKGKDTTHTIKGESKVCKTVEVAAYSGSDEKKTSIDLTPKSSTINGLVSHDSPTGSSWVKLDFTNGTATSVRQSEVRPNTPNTGWFVFYNAGTPQFRDVKSTTSFADSTATMEVAFTDNMSSGFLAPGTGNYMTVRNVSSGGRYFFWADNTSSYGSMDNNDYFGVIKVHSISGSGPYTANVRIYIQYKVPGLRWVVTE